MSTPRFLVVVHDVGQHTNPQSEPDQGLAYFLAWWKAGGWTNEPLYLAVVPAMLGPEERDVISAHIQATRVQVCLHGWDHKQAVLGAEDLVRAHEVFPDATAVCPPYLRYGKPTYEAMGALGLTAIFGGFHGEHHVWGEAPADLGRGVTHLSATPELYRHSYRMVEAVEATEDPGYPLVVNIHHRWDAISLDGVRRLRDALNTYGRIVTLEDM